VGNRRLRQDRAGSGRPGLRHRDDQCRQHPHRLEHVLPQHRLVGGGSAHRLLLLHPPHTHTSTYTYTYTYTWSYLRDIDTGKVGWVRDDLLPGDGSTFYCGF
jgi:hypothetical protein